ncbi:hypothetical protein [Nocardioides sp.]|uniref:hypothetical protein n=1 Tax=Nocardioides sp. TaxID=35761 RepID=UPI0026125C15|nr:hypothetical protein [Nocardioides sp.]
MSNGPERQRLDAALGPADEGVVTMNGVLEWGRSVGRLEEVARRLRSAANAGLGIGGQTGPAMFKAMRRSADNLDARVAEFRRGQAALESAAQTITNIRAQRNQIDSDPATAPLMDPGSFSDNPEWDDEKRMTEQGKHNAAVSAFQEREALREQRAREIAEEFDRRYEEPIAVMKSIHGLPDPEEPGGQDGPGGGDGPSARAPIPGGRGPSGTTGTTYHPTVIGQPTDIDPGDTNEVDPIDNGTEPEIKDPTVIDPTVIDPVDPTGPTTIGPTGPGGTGLVPGGVGTAVGVGLGGGALLGGLAKGVGIVRGIGAGVLAPGQQARPLGGLSRSAVSGTLGRGAVAGAPAQARPAARGGVGATSTAGRTTASGRGAAAAGAGGRGSGGARTGAAAGGGRGGAAGAGAARRRGRGDDAADREHYDDGQDWLDDEAAPGVLD